ncbi:MAG: Gfo/Idh/MocA family oxidoreductase, partial [Planctomycetes bacterium]|nr:Gfo/Idh/MocA family oxidoreductase [Planctomycetota bacterium]
MGGAILDRRDFLCTSAALAAVSFVGGCAAPRRQGLPPSQKLNLGFVGVANRAGANLSGLAGENVVALCDVDDQYLGRAAQAHPRARRYYDFRQMLDVERLDAVVVSTADHTHAPATLMALGLGMDVYCEKPLTHNVREARLVAEATKRQRAITQMGTQIHAGANYRRVVELVQGGAPGPARGGHPRGAEARGGGGVQGDPAPAPPVPRLNP